MSTTASTAKTGVTSRSDLTPQVLPTTSKPTSPSRAHRNCSPNPNRRLAGARRGPGTRLVSRGGRAGGGVARAGGVTVPLRAGAETRVSRVPIVKGKENRGGGRVGGARIAKPVTTRRYNIPRQVLGSSSAPGVLTEAPQDEENLQVRRPKSSPVLPVTGLVLKSKVVPDLHQKFLKKIRQNKRRSLERRPADNWSPCRAPAPSADVERESPSPVSGSELQMYLSGVFDIADKYKSGTVSAGSLLECITGMVDLPKLEKWKLEELKRMLDPKNDNRYVDSDTWAVVGKSWVEMMLNPDFHATTPVSDRSSGSAEVQVEISEEHLHQKDEVFEDTPESPEIGNVSFEGFGGFSYQLNTNREFELQGKVNELEFQLAKLREEKRELENSLVASEEFGMSLTTELEDSHKRLSLSSNILKDETIKENSQLAREWEQQCCSLQHKLGILEEEMKAKDEMLEDNEVLIVNLRAETAEAKEKEAAALALVEKLREKVEKVEQMVKKKDEEITKEILARELIEERFEDSRAKVDRLRQNLSMKEEEIRNLTETTGSRLGSVGSSAGANNSLSTVHDVSVDEKAIEAQQSLLTPSKLALPSSGVLVKLRGPSASSTPNKLTLGSIAEELMDLNQINDNEALQSPFCEKKESQVGVALDRLFDNICKAIGTDLDPNRKKEFVTIIGREIFIVKHFLEEIINDLPNMEDFLSLKETNNHLEKKLSEANLCIDNLNLLKTENNSKIADEEEEDVALEEVANISMKVGSLADRLRKANSQVRRTEDTDFSLDPDTDVSGFHLDLEGIQLQSSEYQRLVNISKKMSSGQEARSAFPTELSRSPVPGNSLLWQSLHKRLEDLTKESEMSCDLLRLAGDSLRERSLQSASLALTRSQPPTSEISNVQMQTEEAETNHETTQTEETVTPHTSCPTANCFCSRSEAKRQTASRFSSMFRGVFITVLLLFFFTFFCGLQIDNDTYYPVTWYSLRMALGDGLPLPEPVIAVNYQTGGRS